MIGAGGAGGNGYSRREAEILWAYSAKKLAVRWIVILVIVILAILLGALAVHVTPFLGM